MKDLDNTANGYEMNVNIKKTKVMQISKKAENDMNIFFKNQVLEQIDRFKYPEIKRDNNRFLKCSGRGNE